MTEYNGWTNYATWRVNREIFDPTWRVHPEIFDGGNWDRYSADDLRQFVEDQIIEGTGHGIARDYAIAFLEEVNWREIAGHLKEEEAAA
jgi:hypothetical protein